MRITAYQREVLDALPAQILWLVSRKSRFAREAVEEFDVLCTETRDAISRRLHDLRVSGAYPDPELTWSALGKGRRAALVAELEQCDEREHAVSLALRLLAAEDQGDAC